MRPPRRPRRESRGCGRQCQRARFVAQRGQLRHGGADEEQASVGAGLDKIGALAQVAAARMHIVAASIAGQRQQPVDVEIAGGPRPAQRHGARGDAAVCGGGLVGRFIGGFIGRNHCRALPAPVGGGLRHAQDDFAAVGDADEVGQAVDGERSRVALPWNLASPAAGAARSNTATTRATAVSSCP